MRANALAGGAARAFGAVQPLLAADSLPGVDGARLFGQADSSKGCADARVRQKKKLEQCTI